MNDPVKKQKVVAVCKKSDLMTSRSQTQGLQNLLFKAIILRYFVMVARESVLNIIFVINSILMWFLSSKTGSKLLYGVSVKSSS